MTRTTASPIELTALLKKSNRSTTYPEVQWPTYPEGFQGEQIPVYGPYVAELIEGRADGKF